jgi:hypothetical protein
MKGQKYYLKTSRSDDCMNLEESLERRISTILGEAKRRGFEAVVFMNEVIGQNPCNFVYVSGPWGLGDEHNTLVFDVNGAPPSCSPTGARRGWRRAGATTGSSQ